MKCTNCEMTNQLPGTKCSHCGRTIPDPKPITLEVPEEENAEGESSGVSEGTPETETGEAPEVGTETDPQAPAEEVVPESGHVDNVGDESESETVVP